MITNKMNFSYFLKSFFIVSIALIIWFLAFFSGNDLWIYSSYLLWLPIAFLVLGIGRHMTANFVSLFSKSSVRSAVFAIMFAPGLVPGHPPAPAPAVILLLLQPFLKFSDVFIFNFFSVIVVWIIVFPLYLIFLSKRGKEIPKRSSA
ncbi:MAG: hypothetical protein HY755_12270 [Nitrospirae bacterium]|nr:hypothetical protein [Nitrospirota bacterium]